MTAPDCSSLVVTGDRAGDRTTVRVGLEWPRKPDYLALIAARDWGLAASRGISLELGEPKAHSDGLAALERGECDLILINPLHLLERRPTDARRSAACRRHAAAFSRAKTG